MAWDFEGIENVRELGGLVREDGAQVREGLLFRAGTLADASDGDIKTLENIGLCAVVDFRDEAEARRSPDRDVPGAAYYHLPALPDLGRLLEQFGGGEYTPENTHAMFRELYRYLALSVEAHEAYARFFEILLASGGKPVLWHCTQGKDRTGAAAMLLLTALGFDEEAAVGEYLLTNRFAQRQLDAYAAEKRSPRELAVAREFFCVFEENAKYYLDCVRMEYGSVINFLALVLGVGPGERETLARYYLEGSSCKTDAVWYNRECSATL